MIFKQLFTLITAVSLLPISGMDYTSLYQDLDYKPLLALSATAAAGLATIYTIKKCFTPKSPHQQLKTQNLNTLSGWQKACQLCMQYKKTIKSPITAQQFIDKIDQFCKSRDAILNKEDYWVIQPNKITQIGIDRFYVQKVEVPAGTNVIFHGDIHGDIASFNAFLDFLKQKNHITDEGKVNPGTRVFLLGDMVDRGDYGVEVIYKALDLQLKNPENFFVLRGNHEDVHINEQYGFKSELERKFIDPDTAETSQSPIAPITEKLYQLYNKLPVAAYLVSGKPKEKNAILCCHGGLEIGFDKTRELLSASSEKQFIPLEMLVRAKHTDKLDQDYKDCLKRVPHWWMKTHKATDSHTIGFLWNDFNFNDYPQQNEDKKLPKHTLVHFDNHRGLVFPKDFTQAMLELDSAPECKIRGIFRAHQHGPETMPRILNQDNMSDPQDAGVAKLWLDKKQKQPAGKLWDGIVCTFCVSPHNGYYGGDIGQYRYNFDSFGILTTADNFDDWRLDMQQLNVQLPHRLD